MIRKPEPFKHLIKLILILQVLIPGTMFSQESDNNELPQYLFPSFSSGKLKMKRGPSSTLKLNYNTLSGKIVFEKGDDYLDLLNQGMVDTAYISGKQLVPHDDAFFEVVVNDSVSFLIQHKGNMEERGKSSGYGTYSATSAIDSYSSISTNSKVYNLKIPDQFVVKQTKVFWIKDGNNWSEFHNEKQFLGIFPDRTDLLKKYIKENKLKLRKEEDVAKLVAYLNDLIKQGN